MLTRCARSPRSFAIAYGAAKVPAARAVLRSGLVSGLVTHTSFAQALLDGGVTGAWGPSGGRSPAPDEPEVPLPGGMANRGQVVRVGDTVRRPRRSTSPASARPAAPSGGRRVRRGPALSRRRCAGARGARLHPGDHRRPAVPALGDDRRGVGQRGRAAAGLPPRGVRLRSRAVHLAVVTSGGLRGGAGQPQRPESRQRRLPRGPRRRPDRLRPRRAPAPGCGTSRAPPACGRPSDPTSSSPTRGAAGRSNACACSSTATAWRTPIA